MNKEYLYACTILNNVYYNNFKIDGKYDPRYSELKIENTLLGVLQQIENICQSLLKRPVIYKGGYNKETEYFWIITYKMHIAIPRIFSDNQTDIQVSSRLEFETEYGKNKQTGYGQWLPLNRHAIHKNHYEHPWTEYAWIAFCHGRSSLNNPNLNSISVADEFEREYGKDEKTGYGQWLDLTKMPNNQNKYKNIITEYAWKSFRHGKRIYNPNSEE